MCQTRGCKCGLNTELCFPGVTHEWMSSLFDVLFLFLIAVLSSLSSWDEMKVCVKLLAYDVWSAEDDKTGLLSVEVDSFESIIFEKRPISLPVVQISTLTRKYDKLG